MIEVTWLKTTVLIIGFIAGFIAGVYVGRKK